MKAAVLHIMIPAIIVASGLVANAAPPMLLGTYAGAIRTADGHIDIATITSKLAEGGFNFYNDLIQHNEHDWSDLPGFLALADVKRIKVMVALLPESEPPCSKPFCWDFEKWGSELAKLSLIYKNLIGYTIDDWYICRPKVRGETPRRP